GFALVRALWNGRPSAIGSRIRSLGWESRSSLTMRYSWSANCTRNQPIVRLPALLSTRVHHPCQTLPQDILAPQDWERISQGRAGYNFRRASPFSPEVLRGPTSPTYQGRNSFSSR